MPLLYFYLFVCLFNLIYKGTQIFLFLKKLDHYPQDWSKISLSKTLFFLPEPSDLPFLSSFLDIHTNDEYNFHFKHFV